MIPGTGQRIDAFRMALIGFVVLCLCASSWGACGVQAFGGITGYQVCGTDNDRGGLGSDYAGCQSCETIGTCTMYNYTYTVKSIGGGSRICWMDGDCGAIHWCDTQAEADSVKCALNPTDPSCVEEDVPEACEEQYSSCMNAGGVWKKVGTSGSNCTSVCDLCGSGNAAKFMNRLNSYCCNQPGMAPPDSAAMCYTPSSIPNDMTVSTIVSSRNEVIAGCSPLTTSDGQMIDESAANYKRFCEDGEQYEEQEDTNSPPGSSSSDGGISSSGEGGGTSDSGTSFGTELEALGGIYGVLDTIRDTLVKRLTPATEEIRDCLYNARLCLALDSIKVDWSNMPKDSTWFYIDTGLVKYLRPFMDASVALDSNQLKAIRKLDTNILKQLHLDSAMLKNDTSTRRAVNSGFEGVLKNDTVTRRAVNRLDTTVVSLDSSLRKGIREGTDNLIDSMDRYLGRVDSSIGAVGSNGTPLGDSLGKLIGFLGGDTGSVGSGAYGDSASAYGDSIRKWIREGDGKWDSAFRATEGEWGVDSIDDLYDSSFSYGTCHGDDCPPCTDSDCLGKITPAILKYGDSVAAMLGDTLAKNVKAQEDSLPTMWDSAMVKLREVSFFSTFDSTFLANIGAKIPNTNTCPEDCFRQEVNGRYAFVPYNVVLDWKLCRPIAPGVLNNLNAFDILKLLARVLTVVTCLFILMWEVSSRRGGGIGL